MIAALALGLVAVVTAASDEGGLAWGVRAGSTLPLAPVCSAIGAWLALAPARARGDDRALAAIGRSPWEREAAAIAGGAVIALFASLTIAILARVEELSVSREIAAIKSRLQRLSPVAEPTEYNRMFGDLVALEGRHRALWERVPGSL